MDDALRNAEREYLQAPGRETAAAVWMIRLRMKPDSGYLCERSVADLHVKYFVIHNDAHLWFRYRVSDRKRAELLRSVCKFDKRKGINLEIKTEFGNYKFRWNGKTHVYIGHREYIESRVRLKEPWLVIHCNR